MQIKNLGPTGVPTGVVGKAVRTNTQKLQKILQKLSTAKQINTAADNAAGLAVAEQLQSRIRGYKMASQNISDAVSVLNITDGAANTTVSLLQRQRELAIASRNGTLNDENRKALDTEFQAITQEIDRLAQATQFNTQNVAGGTQLASGNAAIQTGSNAGETMNLPQVNLTASNLGVNGVSIASAAGAQSAIDRIDTALQSLNTQRSVVGATVNQLESTANNLNVAIVNTQAAESVIRDQDMAQGIADLTRERLLQEGSVKTFARFNEISQNHIMGLLQ